MGNDGRRTLSRNNDPNWRRLFALMGKFPLTREEHHQFCSVILRRDITSRKQLRPLEVVVMCAAYEGYAFMAHLIRDARDSGRRFVDLDDPASLSPDPKENHDAR